MDGFWFGFIWVIVWAPAITITKKWWGYVRINLYVFAKSVLMPVFLLLVAVVAGIIFKASYIQSALFDTAQILDPNKGTATVFMYQAWFWLNFCTGIYSIVFLLLVWSISSMHMLIDREGSDDWSTSTRRDFFRGVLKRQKQLSEMIATVSAVSNQLSIRNAALYRHQELLKKQNISGGNYSNKQAESIPIFKHDFEGFYNKALEEIGYDFEFVKDGQAQLRINNKKTSMLKSLCFVTATPVLSSLQKTNPIYNKDAPENWQKYFCEPLLDILDLAGALEEFTWVYLSPESLKNRRGFVKLNPLCSTEEYTKGVKAFLSSIESRLKRPKRSTPVVPLFQEVAYLPLVMIIIERTDGSKHVSVGLNRVIDDSMMGLAVDPEENIVSSIEFASTFSSIHSSSSVMVDFFKSYAHDIIHADKRYAEAIQDFLRFGKDTGTKMIFQAKYNELERPEHGYDPRGKVTHVLFSHE